MKTAEKCENGLGNLNQAPRSPTGGVLSLRTNVASQKRPAESSERAGPRRAPPAARGPAAIAT
eukprot:7113711-Prymnesium_polylepis.1